MSKKVLTIDSYTVYNKLLNDKNITFKDICKTIQNKNIKKCTYVFLCGIFGKKSLPFKVEIFLSLFLIYRFHKQVFEGQRNTVDENLLNLVNEIVGLLRKDLIKNKKEISRKLLEFNEKFIAWKIVDLHNQLKLYSETYYELEILKLKMIQYKETSTVYTKSIVPLQNKILRLVKFIAGEKGIKYIKNYKDTQFKLTVSLEKKLRDKLKKAFWQKFREELFQIPSNYTQIVDLFKDIRLLYMSIVNCLSEKGKSLRIQEIDSILDCEYLKTKQDNNSLTEDDILITCMNILEQIHKIGFASNDIKTKDMITKINTFVNKNTNDTENDNFKEMVEVFQMIICQLEELQKFFLNNAIDGTIDLKNINK